MSRSSTIRIAASLAAALAIAACGKPEEPKQNEADIAKIIAAGQAKVNERASEAVQEHLDRVVDADGKPLTPGDMKQDVDSLYKVDTELAEANYKVAKEKCDTSAGAAKDDCLKLAKADYEVAMADAQAKQAGAKAEIESAAPPK
ncbi:MAG: hypothetical protein Q8Q73_19420 [Stagnimonas sp.]|nr:hypothetical protein [Stagnimonas sp.]